MALQQSHIVALLNVSVAARVCRGHPVIVHMDGLEVHPRGGSQGVRPLRLKLHGLVLPLEEVVPGVVGAGDLGWSPTIQYSPQTGTCRRAGAPC